MLDSSNSSIQALAQERSIMKQFFLFVCISLLTWNSSNAQQNELAQANTQFKAYLFKEAIPLYERALALDPYLGDAMLNLARCYYYTNNLTKAAEWYDRILRYDSYKQYSFEYGLVLKMQGKYAEAKRWFDQSIKTDGIKAGQYSRSCESILKAGPLDNIYQVKALPSINSKSADFAPTFYNKELIFASSRAIAIEKQGEIAWTNDAFNQHYIVKTNPTTQALEVEALRSFVGNDINDGPMSYAPNADVVAITSNNFMDGIRHIPGSGLMMDIYLYNNPSKNEWDHSSEQFFPFNANVNTEKPFSTGHPCLIDNGTTLYFSSNRPGGYGGYDLYMSKRTAAGWSTPQNLGAPINTPGNELTPFVDENGRLYFASDWHPGYGGLDLFTTARYNYSWGPVQNMGHQVNSVGDDLYLVFDANRKIGYFTSNRSSSKGNEDIYQFTQTLELPKRQSLPLNIGDKFILGDRYFRPGDGNLENTNSAELASLVQRLKDNPSIVLQINGHTDAGGKSSSNLSLSESRARALAEFLTSRGIRRERLKSRGYGEQFLVNRCSDNVNCSSAEHAQNRRLEIFAVGILNDDGSTYISYDATPKNSGVPVAQPAANRSGSNSSSKSSSRSTSSSSSSSRKSSSSRSYKPKRKDHYAIGDMVEVASIFYERSKSRIDERKSPGLKELLSILEEHKHVVIEIAAHTDATGPSKYNKELSEQRAQAVKKYLEKKGISSSRLVAKGYGESKILNRCKDGVRCSDSEHAENRRTEFKVIAQKGFKVGDIIKVDNINYERDKAKLDMKDSRGLAEIIQLLKDNKISVEIRSHTDSRGTSKYNLELSEKRAKAVYDYLVKSGVNKYRLKYKGYGESKPLNKCKDGVRCSDREHAKNRRTDFKVIGLR